MVGVLDKLRVLIVEDDFLISQDLGETIRRAGGDVVGPAMTAPAALELLEQAVLEGGLHGALLDVSLGSADSGAVARALGQRNGPYVVVTGYGEDMIPRDMRGAPALIKPFSRDDLLTVASRCFRRPAPLAA